MIARWPQHHVVAALLAGLVLGPRLTAVVPVLAGVAWLSQPRRGWAVVAVAAVLVGAVGGAARLDLARERATAPLRTGPAVGPRERVEVTAEPHRALDGAWKADARVRGATVELRLPVAPAPPPAVRTGALLRLRGALRTQSPLALGARSRGVLLALDVRAVVGVDGRRGGWRGRVDRLRERAERALDTGDPHRTALLRGMVLGRDDDLAPDQVEAYRRSGLSHLVAASGQNVALLVALVLLVGAALGVPRRPRIALAIAAVATYVPLAGAGPSIRRAGVMGVLTLLALALGRPADRWWALLLAGIATVLVDPWSPDQLGWQLSFCAVVGLAVLADPISRGLHRLGVPRWAGAALAVPVAAGLATAPVLAATVGDVSLTSLPANVLAEPAVAPITWLGMVAALAADAVGPVTTVAVAGCRPLLGWIEGVARWLATPSWAVARPGPVLGAAPAVGALVLVALLARPPALVRAVDVARRHRAARSVRRLARTTGGTPPRRVALLVAVALAAGIVVRLVPRGRPPTPPVAGVVVLDVGQGSATLLAAGGHAILVDAGPADGRVVDRVRAVGIRRIDALVLSHAAADHTGGAPAVASLLRPRLVLDGTGGLRDPATAVARDLVRRAGGRVVRTRAGMRVRTGRDGPALDVRWPPGDLGPVPAGEDPNDRATVVRATVAGVRVLVPSDREGVPLRRAAGGPVDLLVLPHHGSADPDVPNLLRDLRPAAAIASLGRGNGYGHPSPPTVAAVRGADVPFWRTDRSGSVAVTRRPDGRLGVDASGRR